MRGIRSGVGQTGAGADQRNEHLCDVGVPLLKAEGVERGHHHSPYQILLHITLKQGELGVLKNMQRIHLFFRSYRVAQR
jgi:hypothetical protein